MQIDRLIRRPPRRGSIYFSVLAVALMVSVIGVTAMRVARMELEKVNAQHDADYARILAQSSVEFALGRIEADVDWRNTYTHDEETSVSPAGVGETLYFRLLDDSDDDLANDTTQPVDILGVGRHGDATYVYKVTYDAGTSPDEQVGPVVHAQYDAGGGAESTLAINDGSSLGQYFVPNLPAEAIEWSILSVDVLAKENGSGPATLLVCIYSADVGGMPATMLECSSVDGGQLASTYGWVTVPLTAVHGLSPGQGICVGLEGTSPSWSVDVQFEGGGVSQTNSHMIEGGNGTWANTYADKSIYYCVRGFYKTAAGAATEFQITPGSWQRTTKP